MCGGMLEGKACNGSRDRWRGSIHGTSFHGFTIVKRQTVSGVVVEHMKCQ
jgi:hypothetical protein